MPTATNMGERAPMHKSAIRTRSNASSPQAISPPTIPLASCAIKPACGRRQGSSANAPGIQIRFMQKDHRSHQKNASSVTVITSTSCIFQGVPPSSCPALKS